MSPRVIWRVALVLLLDALTLLALSEVIDGFVLDGAVSALGAAAMIGLLNALVWPALSRLALPLTVLTLGLAGLLLNGLLVTFAIDILPNAEIGGVGQGVVVTIVLTAVTSAVFSLLAIDEDDAWYRHVVRRQLRRRGASVETDVPGVAFLEIDGLAHDVLERAIADGRRPAPGGVGARGLAPPPTLGDRLVLADRRLPGRTAPRLERGHAGLPLVGEGAGPGDRHQPPPRCRRARAAALRRPRAAARRRRQPRQHPLRRRRALDADDEHGASPPPADRP